MYSGIIVVGSPGSASGKCFFIRLVAFVKVFCQNNCSSVLSWRTSRSFITGIGRSVRISNHSHNSLILGVKLLLSIAGSICADEASAVLIPFTVSHSDLACNTAGLGVVESRAGIV